MSINLLVDGDQQWHTSGPMRIWSPIHTVIRSNFVGADVDEGICHSEQDALVFRATVTGKQR